MRGLVSRLWVGAVSGTSLVGHRRLELFGRAGQMDHFLVSWVNFQKYWICLIVGKI